MRLGKIKKQKEHKKSSIIKKLRNLIRIYFLSDGFHIPKEFEVLTRDRYQIKFHERKRMCLKPFFCNIHIIIEIIETIKNQYHIQYCVNIEVEQY